MKRVHSFNRAAFKQFEPQHTLCGRTLPTFPRSSNVNVMVFDFFPMKKGGPFSCFVTNDDDLVTCRVCKRAQP